MTAVCTITSLWFDDGQFCRRFFDLLETFTVKEIAKIAELDILKTPLDSRASWF